jgi:hypothetical protein
MNKGSTYKTEGAPDRAISISAYEIESSLDKRKPIFDDPDPEGEKLEKNISKKLDEELSDDAQDGDAPDVFESRKKVPVAVSEPNLEKGGGCSEMNVDGERTYQARAR